MLSHTNEALQAVEAECVLGPEETNIPLSYRPNIPKQINPFIYLKP